MAATVPAQILLVVFDYFAPRDKYNANRALHIYSKEQIEKVALQSTESDCVWTHFDPFTFFVLQTKAKYFKGALSPETKTTDERLQTILASVAKAVKKYDVNYMEAFCKETQTRQNSDDSQYLFYHIMNMHLSPFDLYCLLCKYQCARVNNLLHILLGCHCSSIWDTQYYMPIYYAYITGNHHLNLNVYYTDCFAEKLTKSNQQRGSLTCAQLADRLLFHLEMCELIGKNWLKIFQYHDYTSFKKKPEECRVNFELLQKKHSDYCWNVHDCPFKKALAGKTPVTEKPFLKHLQALCPSLKNLVAQNSTSTNSCSIS